MAKLTLGGADVYEELRSANSPSLTGNRKDRKIQRTLLYTCSSPESFTEINAIIAELQPPFGAPGRYPVSGSIFFVDTYKVTPRSKGNGEVGGIGTAEVWQIDVTYSPLPYNTTEDEPEPMLRNLTRTWSGSGEYVTIPGTSIYWEGDDDPAGDESVPSVIRIANTQHSHHRQNIQESAIPWAQMRAVVGKVNATDFGDTHPIFPGVKAEQLLFEDWDLSFNWTSEGQREWTVTLNFKERMGEVQVRNGVGENDLTFEPITWNHFWDKTWYPGTTPANKYVRGWRKIFRDPKPAGNQTKPLYETATVTVFNNLFL